MNYFRPLVCYTVEKAWETLEKVSSVDDAFLFSLLRFVVESVAGQKLTFFFFFWQVWVRMDEGDKSASWRSVASEEGGGLLLM